MEVTVKRLNKDAIMPKFQTDGSIGFDFHSTDHITIWAGERTLVGTGLAFDLTGLELQIRPRSGIAYKNGVTVLNSPATIDSDYKGEIKILLINHGEKEFTIKKGERIAQGVLKKVDYFSFIEGQIGDSERGEKGFGSTGK